MEKKSDYSFEERIRNRNSWLVVISICFLLLLIGFCVVYYLISGQKINLDVPTILSTLLAFFSIYLSAIFYFKATEQSNQFYESSYNHNKNIAESLSGMKGEFGKSLGMIEKHNDVISQRMDRIPWDRIGEKRKEIESIKGETENTLKDLLKDMGIEEDRQAELIKVIENQEEQIGNLQEEIYKLTNNVGVRAKPFDFYNMIADFVQMNDPAWIYSSSEKELSAVFKGYTELLAKSTLKKLMTSGIIDKSRNLTAQGDDLIRTITAEYL